MFDFLTLLVSLELFLRKKLYLKRDINEIKSCLKNWTRRYPGVTDWFTLYCALRIISGFSFNVRMYDESFDALTVITATIIKLIILFELWKLTFNNIRFSCPCFWFKDFNQLEWLLWYYWWHCQSNNEDCENHKLLKLNKSSASQPTVLVIVDNANREDVFRRLSNSSWKVP